MADKDSNNNVSCAKPVPMIVEGAVRIDAYRLPNGDFGVDAESAAIALGFPEDWLLKALEEDSEPRQTLETMGFTGSYFLVSSDKEESVSAKVILLDDFNTLIIYALTQGKEEAIAFQKGLNKMSLPAAIQSMFMDAEIARRWAELDFD